jgi:hypothetical protein
MKVEDKKNLREAMYAFYKDKFGAEGFPDKPIANPARAIEALPDLYRNLEDKKVLPLGIDFRSFQRIAVEHFRQAHLYSQLSKRGFF